MAEGWSQQPSVFLRAPASIGAHPAPLRIDAWSQSHSWPPCRMGAEMGRDRELGGEIRDTEISRKAAQHRDISWDEAGALEGAIIAANLPKTQPISERGCLAAARDIRGRSTIPSLPVGETLGAFCYRLLQDLTEGQREEAKIYGAYKLDFRLWGWGSA